MYLLLQEVLTVALESEVVSLVRELGELHKRSHHLPNLDDARQGIFLSHLGWLALSGY